MTVITTFSEKQREKKWKFERKVLRELSLTQLRNHVKAHFDGLFPFDFLSHPFLMDPCIDMAIDAYLLGAEYSRLGYYGEQIETVRSKCAEDIQEMNLELLDILDTWVGPTRYDQRSLFKRIETFVEYWWNKGFIEGKKRYQLRLH